MYLWKTEKLIADFQENKVSEKEKLKYVIFAVAVCSLLTNPIVAMSEKVFTSRFSSFSLDNSYERIWYALYIQKK